MKCVNRLISMLLDWSSPEKCLYFVVKCRFLVKKCTFLAHWLGWSSMHGIVHLTKNDHHYGPSTCGQVHKLWSSAFDTRLMKCTFFFHQQPVKHAWVQVVKKWLILTRSRSACRRKRGWSPVKCAKWQMAPTQVQKVSQHCTFTKIFAPIWTLYCSPGCSVECEKVP